MSKITTIVVDDETPSRNQLIRYINEIKSFELVAECSSGEEAIKEIIQCDPDVVFLDIEMPQLDGFEIIDNISNKEKIYWVFVTAYPQYAIRAFEVEARDYLLKPYDKARFLKTVSKIKSTILNQSDTKVSKKEPLAKLLVKYDDQLLFINCTDIICIEAEGNYIKLRTNDGNYTIRHTLKDIASKLHPNKFFRIHRSMVINIDFVESIEPWFYGDYKIRLKDGQQVKMSRNYKELLDIFQ